MGCQKKKNTDLDRNDTPSPARTASGKKKKRGIWIATAMRASLDAQDRSVTCEKKVLRQRADIAVSWCDESSAIPRPAKEPGYGLNGKQKVGTSGCRGSARVGKGVTYYQGTGGARPNDNRKAATDRGIGLFPRHETAPIACLPQHVVANMRTAMPHWPASLK